MSGRRPRVGLLLASPDPAEELLATAHRAQAAGLDEAWIGEDYFFHGGIALGGALLARTRLTVGLGILPGPGRHPAVLAMEVATLAGLYPGRLYAGLGAGAEEVLEPLELVRRSPLGSNRDTLTVLRDLLAAREVTARGEGFALHGVRLEHAPASPPPLYLGVSGPRSLRLSGRIADGTVLSVLAGVEYVGWARRHLTEGGAGPGHRVVVYAFRSIDDDEQRARDLLRPLFGLYLLLAPRNVMTQVQGIADEAERIAEPGLEKGTAAIPDAWLSGLSVCGTPAQCAAQLHRLTEAGADLVALCFPAGEAATMLDRLASDVLPLLGSEGAAS